MIAWSMLDGWPLGIALFRNIFWVTLALIEYALGYRIATWQAVRVMRKLDPNWAEEQSIEFDDSGVLMRSASSSFSFRWSELRRVVETNHVWLIYVGTKVAFIPLRVPRDAGVLDRLRQFMKEKAGKPVER